MTTENRIIAKLSDIVLIRFECRKCHAVSAWEPARWQHVPRACPNCSEVWLIPGSLEEIFIQNLKMNIGQMARMGNDYPFEFAFEFDGEAGTE